jgi:FKBP-type peptidyl-prolyl cis-trans isomerase 2
MAWEDPQMGTPIEGTIPGLGYYTTIPGFNDALKGLSTNTVHVVRLAPEQAYTRSGNEKHPLYGDALVFYIKVVDVVDAPCPLEAARICGALTPDATP